VGRGESREKNPSKVFLPLPLSQLCFFLLHNVFMATRNSRHKSHEQTFFIHPVGSQVNQLQNLTVSFVLKRFFFNFKNVFKLFIYVFFYILNFFCLVFWITFFFSFISFLSLWLTNSPFTGIRIGRRHLPPGVAGTRNSRPTQVTMGPKILK